METPGKSPPIVALGHAAEVDPVCGMTVDPARSAGAHEHGGRTYYFCSPRCRERFAADPTRYVDPGTPAASAARVTPRARAPTPTRASAATPGSRRARSTRGTPRTAATVTASTRAP